MAATHTVENQSEPLVDYNLYEGNHALREALAREGAEWADETLSAFGARVGQARCFELAQTANRSGPELRSHDRFGHRRDVVEFHPAWHELMALGVSHGLHTGPWADPRPGAHVARAAAYMTFAEVENGTQCPMTMTYGSVPAISREPALAERWLPRLLTREYDPSFRPVDAKRGALIGMGLTEKQGGSDVRANTTRAQRETTRARRAGDREYRLTGHKWFMSAPMCDGFLVTAHSGSGISCFFVPRFTPDGEQNALHLQRLKDKLGNRSNASSEVEFDGAWGWMVGEENRGIPAVLEMGVYTRLDCAIGSSGILRQCVAQALHHASRRKAFGRTLREHPVMKNVLADLVLESEGAIALSMRLARAYDRAGDEMEAAFRRLVTAVAKFWICKRAIQVAAEAMEVLGGNGYVEEASLARLYREAPVNSIWEGSGNIMCLDVLRALSRSPECAEALRAELAAAAGQHPAYDRHLGVLEARLRSGEVQEASARQLTQAIAVALQASLLLRGAPEFVSHAFCESRLAQDDWGACFGVLGAGAPRDALIDRAMPVR